MLRMVKQALKSALAKFGYNISKLEIFPPDFDSTTQALCRTVMRYSLTSPERVLALRDAVEYVLMNKIPGDIVECGVWKGGSMMVCALTLLAKSERRDLWLFDTFEGMPSPTEADITYYGFSAHQAWENSKGDWDWDRASLDEVQKTSRAQGIRCSELSS